MNSVECNNNECCGLWNWTDKSRCVTSWLLLSLTAAKITFRGFNVNCRINSTYTQIWIESALFLMMSEPLPYTYCAELLLSRFGVVHCNLMATNRARMTRDIDVVDGESLTFSCDSCRSFTYMPFHNSHKQEDRRQKRVTSGILKM